MIKMHLQQKCDVKNKNWLDLAKWNQRVIASQLVDVSLVKCSISYCWQTFSRNYFNTRDFMCLKVVINAKGRSYLIFLWIKALSQSHWSLKACTCRHWLGCLSQYENANERVPIQSELNLSYLKIIMFLIFVLP